MTGQRGHTSFTTAQRASNLANKLIRKDYKSLLGFQKRLDQNTLFIPNLKYPFVGVSGPAPDSIYYTDRAAQFSEKHKVGKSMLRASLQKTEPLSAFLKWKAQMEVKLGKKPKERDRGRRERGRKRKK